MNISDTLAEFQIFSHMNLDKIILELLNTQRLGDCN